MYAVILAGGGGTRLWPLSRANRPKPFLELIGEGTLLQATVARLSPLIGPRDVFVITDRRYADLCREQLPDVPAGNIIGEPQGRNTAAAVALAAEAIDRPADEVMAILPADHRIADDDGFRAALAMAARAAVDGSLVTLGIQPSGPETGYGYVIAADGEGAAHGAGTATGTGTNALPVERFVEKPTRERATELLAGGRAYWNAGIFVWRRDALLEGLERHASAILAPIRAALSAGDDLAGDYSSVEATSIDFKLLEPASLEGKVRVVPVGVGWSDLGNWATLLEALGEGSGGAEVVQQSGAGGQVIDVGSRDVLVHAAGGRLVATVGLRDLIVVDTPDAVLICARDAAQDVKAIVERLLAEGRRDRL
jgi:mannose-1-phosphate guanylyltransferase